MEYNGRNVYGRVVPLTEAAAQAFVQRHDIRLGKNDLVLTFKALQGNCMAIYDQTYMQGFQPEEIEQLKTKGGAVEVRIFESSDTRIMGVCKP